MIPTGKVGGIKREENTEWPEALEAFGLSGFKAYTTAHGFTSVILPTGFSVIVSYFADEGFIEKAKPGLLAYCMMNQACNALLKKGEPLLCIDGKHHYGWHSGIADMYDESLRRLILEDRGEGMEILTVGQVDSVWVAEQINQRPELLEHFKF